MFIFRFSALMTRLYCMFIEYKLIIFQYINNIMLCYLFPFSESTRPITTGRYIGFTNGRYQYRLAPEIFR